MACLEQEQACFLRQKQPSTPGHTAPQCSQPPCPPPSIHRLQSPRLLVHVVHESHTRVGMRAVGAAQSPPLQANCPAHGRRLGGCTLHHPPPRPTSCHPPSPVFCKRCSCLCTPANTHAHTSLPMHQPHTPAAPRPFSGTLHTHTPASLSSHCAVCTPLVFPATLVIVHAPCMLNRKHTQLGMGPQVFCLPVPQIHRCFQTLRGHSIPFSALCCC